MILKSLTPAREPQGQTLIGNAYAPIASRLGRNPEIKVLFGFNLIKLEY